MPPPSTGMNPMRRGASGRAISNTASPAVQSRACPLAPAAVPTVLPIDPE